VDFNGGSSLDGLNNISYSSSAIDPLTVIDMMRNNQLQYNFYEEQMQLQRMRNNFNDQQNKLANFAIGRR
jgi:hypothetical protein